MNLIRPVTSSRMKFDLDLIQQHLPNSILAAKTESGISCANELVDKAINKIRKNFFIIRTLFNYYLFDVFLKNQIEMSNTCSTLNGKSK